MNPNDPRVAAVVVGGVLALALAVSLTWRPAPGGAALPTAEIVAPSTIVETLTHGSNPAPTELTIVSPTPAPQPTGYLIGTDAPPEAPAPAYPPQAAPVAPAEAPPVYSELVPIAPTPAVRRCGEAGPTQVCRGAP